MCFNGDIAVSVSFLQTFYFLSLSLHLSFMCFNCNATQQEEGQQKTDAHLPHTSVSNPHSESQLGFNSRLEVPNSGKGPVCLNSTSNAPGKMGKHNGYALSMLNVDIEKGSTESSKSNPETAEHMKIENTFLRAVQRETSLQIGGKFMQLLMNQSFDLPKFTPRDKSRKFKRSTSFNSRQVVLLFSVLSIMRTMILIYLTLRVRQLTDASASA